MQTTMPIDFKYRDVFEKGRPTHDPYDRFYAKHPPMPRSRWAKIYKPFDALRGFDFCLLMKQVIYEDKVSLDEARQDELNHKIRLLQNLTWNKGRRSESPVIATVTYFVPCDDVHNAAFSAGQGTYQTITGTVQHVDAERSRCIRIDDTVISLDDIRTLEVEER